MTSLIGCCNSCDIKPITENITIPAKIDVAMQVQTDMMASLKVEMYRCKG